MSFTPSLYPEVPSAPVYNPEAEVTSEKKAVEFSGYTRAQSLVLAVATVAAIALTVIAAVFGGPVAGVVVGIVTGICVLSLFASFRARVLDAEVYLQDHPGERNVVLRTWILFPRPQGVSFRWTDRPRYKVIASPARFGDSGRSARTSFFSPDRSSGFRAGGRQEVGSSIPIGTSARTTGGSSFSFGFGGGGGSRATSSVGSNVGVGTRRR